MIRSFDEFKQHFQRRAMEDCEVIQPRDPKAYLENWFEREWQDYQRWYKEQYPKLYIESLTLDQLARL